MMPVIAHNLLEAIHCYRRCEVFDEKCALGLKPTQKNSRDVERSLMLATPLARSWAMTGRGDFQEAFAENKRCAKCASYADAF